MRKFKLVEIDQIEVINLEISKGMYVRTHQGIAKIVEKPNISVVVWNDRKVIYVDENGHPVPTSFNFFVFEDEITVFSFSIIDLIQVGDYINGLPVTFVYIPDGVKASYFLLGTYQKHFINEDIKDIVTKEQFEACKYVVERDK